MDIVVLSGKGGTGKTTVATNLSKIMSYAYVDCDVEEPNGYIFLKTGETETSAVLLSNPLIDTDRCIHCNSCVDACEYNALVGLLDRIMLFEELCHGCGACQLVCKTDAVTEIGRPIGEVSVAENFGMGLLNLKEPMGGPIISDLKQKTSHFKNRLIDAPPGTSCSVVKSVEGSDFAVLVTEPTTFGLHDLVKAVELIEMMKIPYGVIINRYDGYSFMDQYLEEHNILCLGHIPFSKRAARLYSEGRLLIEDDAYKACFMMIRRKLEDVLEGRSS